VTAGADSDWEGVALDLTGRMSAQDARKNESAAISSGDNHFFIWRHPFMQILHASLNDK
jgi:hypothetical protein